MVETTKPATPIIIDSEDNSKLKQFIADPENQKYIEGEPYREGKDDAIGVKAFVLTDSNEISNLRNKAKAFGGTLHFSPKAHILFPSLPMEIPKGYTLHFRKKEDFEWGGPQPRIWVLDDPELVALADNIELNGQREPVDASPSPNGSGKLWLIEGHGRFTSIFEILAKRDPQKWVGIWTKEKKRTKLECFEDSVILNGKKKLSAYELGTFIMKLKEEFPEIYISGKHGFNFQETVAKRLGISQQTVSTVLLSFKDVQAQQPRVSEEIYHSVVKLPEGLVREARKAPEEAKPKVYEVVVDQKLETPEVKKVVEIAKANPEISKEDLAAEADRIRKEKEAAAEAKAKQYVVEAEKLEAKSEKSIDKLIEACKPYYPEDFCNTIHAHLSKDSKTVKVDVDKAIEFAKKVVTSLYERVSEEDLQNIFLEADAQ